MKIQSINCINYSSLNFRQKSKHIEHFDDYTTEYNQITFKDAFISAGILSAMLMIGGAIASNSSKIRDFFVKLKQ